VNLLGLRGHANDLGKSAERSQSESVTGMRADGKTAKSAERSQREVVGVVQPRKESINYNRLTASRLSCERCKSRRAESRIASNSWYWTFMRIQQIDLKLVRLPLVRAFQTSSSRKTHLDHILVRIVADGVVGWGECASPSDPYYCPETTETCWHILKDFLAPLVLKGEWSSIEELVGLYRMVKGNRFAKSGLEMACWDALARSQGRSLAAMLGSSRVEILSGVSLGIESRIEILLEQIEQYLKEGYRRIKLKIAPGWDIEPVRHVRDRYPRVALQVDANSAYTLNDLATLRELDQFDLLLIEQPLAHDDIVDHARLQSALKTPICLDESIHSAEDARKALDLGSCRVINIKVSRVGGLLEAKRVHDLCLSRGVPVWCGGMHEFGIGRAANVAIAALPGFTIPGDVSGSDKYYAEDIVEPPILADRGAIAVFEGPGLGVEPIEERIRDRTLRELTLDA
jgi:o-succinylbenzoate synthase